MPVSKKDKNTQDPQNAVVLYDVADDSLKKEKGTVVTTKYSTKNTLNLLMREKSSISFEVFFAVLAIVMLLLALVEYLLVYRPYRTVEELDARRAALEAEQSRIEQKIEDYDEQNLPDDHLKYFYENEDETLVNRLRILDILEDVVFGVGKIQNMSISGNTLQMTMTEVSLEVASTLQNSLAAATVPNSDDDIVRVSYVNVTRNSYNGNGGVPTVNIIITFEIAKMNEQGGN